MFISNRATECLENEQSFRCHFRDGGQRSWPIGECMRRKGKEREGEGDSTFILHGSSPFVLSRHEGYHLLKELVLGTILTYSYKKTFCT